MEKPIDTFDFSQQRVLVRVDLNVPLDDRFQVTDDTRIRACLHTLRHILEKKGSLILMSHLGRPKGKYEEGKSLEHVIPRLSELLGKEVKFGGDPLSEEARKMAESMRPGEVLLLENLRFHAEEKAGDEDFARQLADLADVYVNDAFGVAHRAHASTAVIARFFPGERRMLGYLIEREIEHIDAVLNDPERPLTAIIGGTKVSDKIDTILQLLERIDSLLIGGAMAYTFVRANGGKTGSSLVEEDKLELAEKIWKRAEDKGVSLYLPTDSLIADAFSNEANIDHCPVNDIPEGWMGLDIGRETIAQYQKVIGGSRTILWNGPMGVFEMENFEEGTHLVAEAVAEATDKGAFSLVGGGDSVGAVNKFGLRDRIGFISTGGGAMLEYIEGKALPGIQAIRQD